MSTFQNKQINYLRELNECINELIRKSETRTDITLVLDYSEALINLPKTIG